MKNTEFFSRVLENMPAKRWTEQYFSKLPCSAQLSSSRIFEEQREGLTLYEGNV